MDPQHQRLARAKEIFADALEHPPPERTAILRAACTGDPELLAMVNALLDAHAAAARFMDSPSTAPEAASTIPVAPVEQPGTLIGPYKLLEQIGEGGFGAVFMAEQTEPLVRRVALKVIKLGMDTRQVIARFEAERQALAKMDHPNIAKVLDARATDAGRPYFVMELVRGDPITEYCDKSNLSTAERLDLFTQVCNAVQHAHQKGIIHRDIKPSNVLVTIFDGRPVPKVIDFGIAKAMNQRLTDKTLFTAHRQLIGTPQYMSPEQAEMSGGDIDTRSDIYSLGVLLYELLTGTTPFDAEHLRSAALAEVQRIIREEEPQKPSTRLSSLQTLASVAARRGTEPARLSAMVRGDLDWIAMKCLEKDRTRRYETANGVAMDVLRHLAGEPVVAAPPSRGYRARKFVRRNRGAVSAVLGVGVALVLGVVGTTTFALREADARSQAEERRKDAELAQAESEKRHKETARVAEFQGKMLSDIDLALMGTRLRADLLSEARAAYKRLELSEDGALARIKSLEEAIAGLNFTNVAVESLEQNVLARALSVIDKEFADQPMVESHLYATLADAFESLGRLEQALAANERALAIRRREQGETPDTLGAINNVGLRYMSLGRFDKAEAYLREAHDKLRTLLGEDDARTLNALSNLGALLIQIPGRAAEAELCVRKALDGNRRALGEDDPQTISSITNMSAVLRAENRLAEAEPYYLEAMEKSRRVLGEGHPKTLTAINNLGMFVWEQGRLAEAEGLLRESLDGCRRAHGDDHPATLTSKTNVGRILWDQGKYAEAEPFLRQALEGRRRAFGDDHPETMSTIDLVGHVLEKQGRFKDAEPYFREALDRRRAILGPNNRQTLSSLNNMAYILDHLERPADAERMYREVLERRRQVLGEEDPETLTTLINLATFVLQKRANLSEAEAQFREIVSKANRVWGSKDPRTIRAIGSLANILWQMGNLTEAETYLRQGLDMSRRALGDEHPDTIGAIGNVGQFYWDQGRFSEADALSREQLEACRKRGAATPADRGALAAALLSVGRSLIQQKEYAQAELLLREAVGIREQLFPEGHRESWRTHSVRGILGQALAGQGRLMEAEALIVRAAEAITTDPAVPKATAARDLKRDAVDRVVSLYEAWDKTEPGNGHDIRALEWRDRLNAPDSEGTPDQPR